VVKRAHVRIRSRQVALRAPVWGSMGSLTAGANRAMLSGTRESGAASHRQFGRAACAWVVRVSARSTAGGGARRLGVAGGRGLARRCALAAPARRVSAPPLVTVICAGAAPVQNVLTCTWQYRRAYARGRARSSDEPGSSSGRSSICRGCSCLS